MTKQTAKTRELMTGRFGHDTLLSVATVDEKGLPHVRIVDALYEDGAFYSVTYTLSNKMKQIKNNPAVAVCGEWFTAHGIGENLGWVKAEKNAEMMKKMRAAFAAWYDNGHTDEDDKNTCLLKITLTDGVLFGDGMRYDIDFTE